MDNEIDKHILKEYFAENYYENGNVPEPAFTLIKD